LEQKEKTYSEISKLEKRITQLEKINKDNLRPTNPNRQVKEKIERYKKEEQDTKTRLELLKRIQAEDPPNIISDLTAQISDLETKVENLRSDCLKYAEKYLKEIQEAAQTPQFFGPPGEEPPPQSPAQAPPSPAQEEVKQVPEEENLGLWEEAANAFKLPPPAPPPALPQEDLERSGLGVAEAQAAPPSLRSALPQPPEQLYERPRTKKEIDAQVKAQREQRLASAKPGLLEQPAMPIVKENQLLQEVQESRIQALPEQRQRRKEAQQANILAQAKQAAEAIAPPPVEAQPPVKAPALQRDEEVPMNAEDQAFAEKIKPPSGYRKKRVFKLDDDFTYEGKNYKVREINESDVEGDTTKMKVIDRNKKSYNVELDGKGKTLSFSETDKPVKFGGKNHLTRKQQWTRSKPSRFKTHRIY
jgi:hypothetical protein